MAEIAIRWPAAANEHGGPMLWAGSWLVGDAGHEGPALYSGQGDEHGHYAIPESATGVRIRRWPNEGLEAEYVDVLDVRAQRELWPDQLDFDVRQPYSRLDW